MCARGRHRWLELPGWRRNLGHQTLHLLEELLILGVVHLVLPLQVLLEQRLVVVQLLLEEVSGNVFLRRCFGPVFACSEAVGEEGQVFVQEGLLEGEDCSRVDDGRRVRRAAIHALGDVLNLWESRHHRRLVYSGGLLEHGLQIQVGVEQGTVLLLTSIARDKAKAQGWCPHFGRRVVVCAVHLRAPAGLSAELALLSLIVQVVVLFLLPPMAAAASVLQLATVGVSLRLVSGVPEPALRRAIVFVDVRLAAKVLPVVGIHALVSNVASWRCREGAPYRLEVEEVEVRVPVHLMEHVDAEFLFAVCKGAQFTEFALAHARRERLAELRLVLLRMVELLDSVVRVWTVVIERALVLPVWTDFGRVPSKRAPSILLMVVYTPLQIVPRRIRARLGLEDLEIKKSHPFGVGTAAGAGSCRRRSISAARWCSPDFRCLEAACAVLERFV